MSVLTAFLFGLALGFPIGILTVAVLLVLLERANNEAKEALRLMDEGGP